MRPMVAPEVKPRVSGMLGITAEASGDDLVSPNVTVAAFVADRPSRYERPSREVQMVQPTARAREVGNAFVAATVQKASSFGRNNPFAPPAMGNDPVMLYLNSACSDRHVGRGKLASGEDEQAATSAEHRNRVGHTTNLKLKAANAQTLLPTYITNMESNFSLSPRMRLENRMKGNAVGCSTNDRSRTEGGSLQVEGRG